MTRRKQSGGLGAEVARGIVFLFVAAVGVGVWLGRIRPVAWREQLAWLVGVVAPWLLGALAVAVVVGVVRLVLRDRRAGRSSWRLWGWRIRAWWRTWWHYRHRWARLMTLHGLVTIHDERVLVPRLRRVSIGEDSDTITVTMVPGQAPADWQNQVDALAHAFGAEALRIRVLRPSLLGIDLRYRDALAEPIRLTDRHRDITGWRDAA